MRLDQVKAGMTLIADNGFSCLKNGERYIVEGDADGELYITCDAGHHYLEGQVDEDGELVGLRVEG
jgi:hypothetical protein